MKDTIVVPWRNLDGMVRSRAVLTFIPLHIITVLKFRLSINAKWMIASKKL